MGEEVVATDGEISLCVTENQVRSFWAGGLEPPAGAISDNGDGGINYLAADEPELEIGSEPEHEDMHVDLPLTTSACASDGPGSTPVTTNQKGRPGWHWRSSNSKRWIGSVICRPRWNVENIS